MYQARVYDPAAHAYRVRYAIANILRDRLTNEGAFRVCFEMEDETYVIRSILRRGLRNLKLRTALERSHLVDLYRWLQLYPDLAEAWYADSASGVTENVQYRSQNGQPDSD